MNAKQTLIKGAAVLAAANILVKLIGVFYTIPLARLIGAEGMGLYSSAYQIYLWLFIISTTGLPIAISKLVSEEFALGNVSEAHRVFKVSLGLLTLIGLISSIALFLCSGLILDAIGTERAYLCLIYISPSLFFVAIISAFRGYFQGMQNMVPTAVSEIAEAIGKAAFGLTLAYFLFKKGIEYSSAGAILGVSLGELLGMLCLFVIYYSCKEKIWMKIRYAKEIKNRQSTRTITKKLINIAVPITLGASVFSISSIIDLTMIMRRLEEIGFSETYAIKLYGYLSGFAYKIYSLPITIIIALSVSIVPVIAGSYIAKNMRTIRTVIQTSLRMVFIFSVPAAIGIGVLSAPILKLLFNDSNASSMLMILSIAIIFTSVVHVSGAILQGIGHVMVPVKNLLIGAIIKIVLNYVLVGIPAINILGAPISTTICFMVVSILNLTHMKKIIKIEYDIFNMVIKPLFASIIMGIVVITAYNKTMFIWHQNSISIFLSIFIGMLAYGISIISIGGLRKKDLEMLPFAGKLSRYVYKT